MARSAAIGEGRVVLTLTALEAEALARVATEGMAAEGLLETGREWAAADRAFRALRSAIQGSARDSERRRKDATIQGR